MINTIDPKDIIPSHKHLSVNLFAEMSYARCLLRNSPNHLSFYSLFSFGPTDRLRSFIDITAHYNSNWILETAIIGLQGLKRRHTTENIMTMYEEIINDFDIFHEVTHDTTDKVSNMLKVFSIPWIQRISEQFLLSEKHIHLIQSHTIQIKLCLITHAIICLTFFQFQNIIHVLLTHFNLS